MKLLITGDWHLRFKRPRSRIDPVYFLTQVDKISQILVAAKEEGCDYLLQPGDFFDTDKSPWELVTKYTYLLKEWEFKILCVAGQHDMRYRSKKLDKTPLGVMEANELVIILNGDPYSRYQDERIHFYGASWGEDIPKPEREDFFNVLVTHRMVVDKELWRGQQGHELASHVLREHNYDLIVSGDNHKRFLAVSKGGKKKLVNCGSLMRTDIDQVDHKPAFYVFDTDDLSCEEHLIDVKPHNEVFDLDWVEDVKERSKHLEEFLDSLESQNLDYGTDGADGSLGGLNIIDNLYSAIDQLKVDEGIREIFEEVLGGEQ